MSAALGFGGTGGGSGDSGTNGGAIWHTHCMYIHVCNIYTMAKRCIYAYSIFVVFKSRLLAGYMYITNKLPNISRCIADILYMYMYIHVHQLTMVYIILHTCTCVR